MHQWIRHDIAKAQAVVVTHEDPRRCDHQTVTRVTIARKLAALKGCAFAGQFDPQARYSGRVYHVPGVTLVGRAATEAGIFGEQDLFGGVAPFAHVATKAISHPLVEREADAPLGWSHAFPEAVGPVTLAGVTAFTVGDALRGGERLLQRGAVRIKPAGADGAHGQAIASTSAQLAGVLEAMGPAISRPGWSSRRTSRMCPLAV